MEKRQRFLFSRRGKEALFWKAGRFCCPYLLPLFFVLLGQLSGFADENKPPPSSEDPLKVYGALQGQKSLSTAPQFIVVDDFNSGKLVNARGMAWQKKAPSGGALDLEFDKEDARNPRRGNSLKVSFNLLPGEKAFLESFLRTLDVSQAKYFVFKYRLITDEKHNFKGHLGITLTDWQHREATYAVEKLNSKEDKNWQEAVIDMEQFKGLDFDQLFSIKINFDALDEKIRGVLWLDEMAFFGFNNVAFESNRDNLVGYPKIMTNVPRRKELLGIKKDKTFLKEIAKDTWKYFENARDKKTSLLVDHIGMGETPLAADYTTPTDMAMDLLGTVAAMDLDFISKKEAGGRIRKVLATMKQMPRYKKFFYNFYNTKTLTVTREYISTVDSGWLAIALVVVRQAFPGDIAKDATAFLDSFSFGEFLDPENNQMVIGLDVPERNFGSYHYGMLVTEARATSLYAIGKGDVSRDHWWYLFRTAPAAWTWQNQKPKGKTVEHDGIRVFEGYYQLEGKKFVPSWGGALFEFLMPTLVLKERKLAPKGLGLNDKIATELHRDYALKEKKYPVWGISPAAVVDGRRWRYTEYGIKKLSVKGYPDHQVITPHVSFLALDSLPEDAILNIRKLLEYESYGEYGFYDSINLRTGKTNPQYLALDQGMVLVALCNYLESGSIQERFHKDPVGQKVQNLLKEETFFEG